jgi:hypothetical protein
MKTVYLSGPITGRHFITAAKAFLQAEKELALKGMKVMNPLRLPHREGAGWAERVCLDLKYMMQHCDTIYMLKGWSTSKGARIELLVAKELRLKVIHQ